jgi:hypothetical protein
MRLILASTVLALVLGSPPAGALEAYDQTLKLQGWRYGSSISGQAYYRFSLPAMLCSIPRSGGGIGNYCYWPAIFPAVCLKFSQSWTPMY